MSKEIWIDLYDKMIEEYCEAHPEADERKVYDTLWDTHAGEIQSRYADKIGDMIDRARLAPKKES